MRQLNRPRPGKCTTPIPAYHANPLLDDVRSMPNARLDLLPIQPTCVVSEVVVVGVETDRQLLVRRGYPQPGLGGRRWTRDGEVHDTAFTVGPGREFGEWL